MRRGRRSSRTQRRVLTLGAVALAALAVFAIAMPETTDRQNASRGRRLRVRLRTRPGPDRFDLRRQATSILFSLGNHSPRRGFNSVQPA